MSRNNVQARGCATLHCAAACVCIEAMARDPVLNQLEQSVNYRRMRSADRTHRKLPLVHLFVRMLMTVEDGSAQTDPNGIGDEHGTLVTQANMAQYTWFLTTLSPNPNPQTEDEVEGHKAFIKRCVPASLLLAWDHVQPQNPACWRVIDLFFNLMDMMDALEEEDEEEVQEEEEEEEKEEEGEEEAALEPDEDEEMSSDIDRAIVDAVVHDDDSDETLDADWSLAFLE